MSAPLRFAILGAGFWSRFQLAAWQELDGVECVALCDLTLDKADAVAAEFGIPSTYDDPSALLAAERLDFVDVISDVHSHAPLARLAADAGLDVICQKPLAPSLAEARALALHCERAGVRLYVHENWRWQAPLRALKERLESGAIGQPFRARIQYSNDFPVFDNQPGLRELEQFALADIGSHILDLARFLFGNASRMYCETQQVTPGIVGEDVATVMLTMDRGMSVVCEISYASHLEHGRFPETYVLIEGPKGSLELGPDFWVRSTVDGETRSTRVVPPVYPWADPAYALAHSSMVACNADLLRALQGGTEAETTAADNLHTVELYYRAYESAANGQTIRLDQG